MQTPSRKLLHFDPETACEKTLCVFEGRGVLSLSQTDLQPANDGFSRQLEISKTTVSRKSSLLKELRTSAGKLESSSPETRKVTFRNEPLYETVVPSCDHSRAQLLFPDFFPRGKVFCNHQDCLIPLNFQADPVLVSWLHLFGLKMSK